MASTSLLSCHTGLPSCQHRSRHIRAAATANPAEPLPLRQLRPADIAPVQCLKEWTVTCTALGAGLQTVRQAAAEAPLAASCPTHLLVLVCVYVHTQVLVRKGGIREPTFTPKTQRFLLFPTAFHTDAQLLKPGIAEQFHKVGVF